MNNIFQSCLRYFRASTTNLCLQARNQVWNIITAVSAPSPRLNNLAIAITEAVRSSVQSLVPDISMIAAPGARLGQAEYAHELEAEIISSESTRVANNPEQKAAIVLQPDGEINIGVTPSDFPVQRATRPTTRNENIDQTSNVRDTVQTRAIQQADNAMASGLPPQQEKTLLCLCPSEKYSTTNNALLSFLRKSTKTHFYLAKVRNGQITQVISPKPFPLSSQANSIEKVKKLVKEATFKVKTVFRPEKKKVVLNVSENTPLSEKSKLFNEETIKKTVVIDISSEQQLAARLTGENKSCLFHNVVKELGRNPLHNVGASINFPYKFQDEQMFDYEVIKLFDETRKKTGLTFHKLLEINSDLQSHLDTNRRIDPNLQRQLFASEYFKQVHNTLMKKKEFLMPAFYTALSEYSKLVYKYNETSRQEKFKVNALDEILNSTDNRSERDS